MKMLALYQNVGAVACMRKVSAFWKCWRTWKSRRSMKMSVLEKVGALYNETWKIDNICTSWPSYCLSWQNPQWLLSSAFAGGSCSVLKVLSPPLVCWVPAFASRPAYMGALLRYQPNVGVLLKSRRPIESLWKWTVFIYEIDLAFEDMHGQF
jgi:hypothetical protein